MAQVQEPVAPVAPRSFQRTRPTTVAGLCYLAVIAGGLFAEGGVRGPWWSRATPRRRRPARSSTTSGSGDWGSRFTSSTSSRASR